MKSRWYIMQHPAEAPIARDVNSYRPSAAKSEELYLARSIDRLELFSGIDVSSLHGFSKAFTQYAGILADKERKVLRLHLIKMVCEKMYNGLYVA